LENARGELAKLVEIANLTQKKFWTMTLDLKRAIDKNHPHVL
jgi:hypothetical protein